MAKASRASRKKRNHSSGASTSPAFKHTGNGNGNGEGKEIGKGTQVSKRQLVEQLLTPRTPEALAAYIKQLNCENKSTDTLYCIGYSLIKSAEFVQVLQGWTLLWPLKKQLDEISVKAIQELAIAQLSNTQTDTQIFSAIPTLNRDQLETLLSFLNQLTDDLDIKAIELACLKQLFDLHAVDKSLSKSLKKYLNLHTQSSKVAKNQAYIDLVKIRWMNPSTDLTDIYLGSAQILSAGATLLKIVQPDVTTELAESCLKPFIEDFLIQYRSSCDIKLDNILIEFAHHEVRVISKLVGYGCDDGHLSPPEAIYLSPYSLLSLPDNHELKQNFNAFIQATSLSDDYSQDSVNLLRFIFKASGDITLLQQVIKTPQMLDHFGPELQLRLIEIMLDKKKIADLVKQALSQDSAFKTHLLTLFKAFSIDFDVNISPKLALKQLSSKLADRTEAVSHKLHNSKSRLEQENPFYILSISPKATQDEILKAVVIAMKKNPKLASAIQMARNELFNKSRYLLHRFFRSLESVSLETVPESKIHIHKTKDVILPTLIKNFPLRHDWQIANAS